MLLFFLGLALNSFILPPARFVAAQRLSDDDEIRINWSAFSPEDFMNVNFSKNLILCLPVVQYWDVLKGSFRSAGLIGEKVNVSVNSVLSKEDVEGLGLRGLVSRIDKKVVVRGKSRKMQTDVVELPMVFMHAINAMKDIAFMYEVLKIQVENRGTPIEIQKKSNYFLNRLGPEWILPSEVELRKRLNQIRLDELKYKYEIVVNSKINSQRKSVLRLNASREQMLNSHERLIEAIKLHNQGMFQVQRDRISTLRSLHLEEENANAKDQKSLLDKEFEVDIQLMRENEK